MIIEPRCFTRGCRHYGGVRWIGIDEGSERNVCVAFPKGIPDDIAYGSNLHSTIQPGQVGSVVFEKGPRPDVVSPTKDVT